MDVLKLSRGLKNKLNFNANPPLIFRCKASESDMRSLISHCHQVSSVKNLTSDSWTIFLTAALVSLNRPSGFDLLWTSLASAKETNKREPLYQAKLIRESALKSISFIGIAKSINALNAFRTVIKSRNPELIPKLEEEKPRRIPDFNENSIENVAKRSLSTWESIYRPLDKKLIAKLSKAHPDLPVHILNSHYGPLLSDPASNPGPIGRIGTSLIAIGTLRAAGHLGPQLLSHVFGLRKAGEELIGVGEPSLGEGTQWITSDDAAQWILSVIDRFVEINTTAEITAPNPEEC